MARFDVYENPGSHAATTPYLLDVQSDLLDGLDSRMVVPLRSLAHFPKVKLPTRLTPVLTVDLWEHAYYIDFRNARPTYLNAFWALANWKFAAENFAK